MLCRRNAVSIQVLGLRKGRERYTHTHTHNSCVDATIDIPKAVSVRNPYELVHILLLNVRSKELTYRFPPPLPPSPPLFLRVIQDVRPSRSILLRHPSFHQG